MNLINILAIAAAVVIFILYCALIHWKVKREDATTKRIEAQRNGDGGAVTKTYEPLAPEVELSPIAQSIMTLDNLDHFN